MKRIAEGEGWSLWGVRGSTGRIALLRAQHPVVESDDSKEHLQSLGVDTEEDVVLTDGYRTIIPEAILGVYSLPSQKNRIMVETTMTVFAIEISIDEWPAILEAVEEYYLQ